MDKIGIVKHLSPFPMEAYLAEIVGLVLTLAVDLVKKALKISGHAAFLVVAGCVGVLYAAFVMFFPIALQEQVHTFVLKALGTASAVYSLRQVTKK